MLINKQTEGKFAYYSRKRQLFVSVYTYRGTIRLSLGLYMAMGKPTGVELYLEPETKRLFLMPSTSPSAYRLLMYEGNTECDFRPKNMIRQMLKNRRKIKTEAVPDMISPSGQPMFEIHYQPDKEVKPPLPEVDLPDAHTLAAALQLAEWIVKNRPTSFLKQAEIGTENRELLRRYYGGKGGKEEEFKFSQ
jgi:hypothetical protein